MTSRVLERLERDGFELGVRVAERAAAAGVSVNVWLLERLLEHAPEVLRDESTPSRTAAPAAAEVPRKDRRRIVIAPPKQREEGKPVEVAVAEPVAAAPLHRSSVPKSPPKKCLCCTSRFTGADEELCLACVKCVKGDGGWARAEGCPVLTGEAPKQRMPYGELRSEETRALEAKLRAPLDARVRVFSDEERRAFERERAVNNPARKVAPPTPATELPRRSIGNVVTF